MLVVVDTTRLTLGNGFTPTVLNENGREFDLPSLLTICISWSMLIGLVVGLELTELGGVRQRIDAGIPE
jgi:hypothetical protein